MLNQVPGGGSSANDIRNNWERIASMNSYPVGTTWSATVRINTSNLLMNGTASITAYAICGQ